MDRTSMLRVVAGALLMLVLSGCVSSMREGLYWNRVAIEGSTNSDTVTGPMSENVRRYNAGLDKDARGLLEDVDMALLRDRPSRLTRWADR